jgi:23S rRNA (adenine2503-C2)-methyltransferase
MVTLPTAGANLVGLSREELEQLAVACGQARYRGRQLFRGIYARREQVFSNLTDLDEEFRALLSRECHIGYPEVQREFVSRDGAVRYVLRLEDGKTIEAVHMPERGRTTLCLSSQVGCALDCKFCFTALLGLARNLTPGEIAGQVLALLQAQRIPRRARLDRKSVV